MDRADRDIAVLLTGVGKRYDIVSAFAEHAFVVAADPSRLDRIYRKLKTTFCPVFDSQCFANARFVSS